MIFLVVILGEFLAGILEEFVSCRKSGGIPDIIPGAFPDRIPEAIREKNPRTVSRTNLERTCPSVTDGEISGENLEDSSARILVEIFLEEFLKKYQGDFYEDSLDEYQRKSFEKPLEKLRSIPGKIPETDTGGILGLEESLEFLKESHDVLLKFDLYWSQNSD